MTTEDLFRIAIYAAAAAVFVWLGMQLGRQRESQRILTECDELLDQVERAQPGVSSFATFKLYQLRAFINGRRSEWFEPERRS